MERIANPVTGSVDDGSMPRLPPTRLMVACRYALSLIAPIFIAVVVLGAEQLSWWGPLALYMLVMLPLSAGAQGSWWRVAPWGAWQVAGLVEAGVLLIAMVWSVAAGEPLVMVVVAALLVGATLGVAGVQIWQALGQRRP